MRILLRPVLAAAVLTVLANGEASAATIEFGPLFGGLQPYVDATVSALVTAAFGWAFWLVKDKLKVSIDDSARDALVAWAKRQASSLVADGMVKLNGLKVEVQYTALAAAANTALKFVPDAVARFGMTPQQLEAYIVDHIPHVPSVAAAAAPKPSNA